MKKQQPANALKQHKEEKNVFEWTKNTKAKGKLFNLIKHINNKGKNLSKIFSLSLFPLLFPFFPHTTHKLTMKTY